MLQRELDSIAVANGLVSGVDGLIGSDIEGRPVLTHFHRRPSNVNFPNMACPLHTFCFACILKSLCFKIFKGQRFTSSVQNSATNRGFCSSIVGSQLPSPAVLECFVASCYNMSMAKWVNQSHQTNQVSGDENSAKRSRVVSGTANPRTQRPQLPAQESQSFQSTGTD